MNNKGMTLVELLVTFSLLMIVVVGMFNLILDTKLDLDNKQMVQDISEYSNFLNGDIHYDLITRNPIGIALKITSTSGWDLHYNTNYENEEIYWQNMDDEDDPDYKQTLCGITGDKIYVKSVVKKKNITVKGEKDNISNMCKDFYPCAIYVYYDSHTANNTETQPIFKAIAVNTIKNEYRNYGIRYNNTFEELPYFDYIDVTKTKITMVFDGEYFVIDYPIYLTDNNHNYGFKIAYPVSGVANEEEAGAEEEDDTDATT